MADAGGGAQTPETSAARLRRLAWTCLGAAAGAAAVLSHNMLGPLALATAALLGTAVSLAQPLRRAAFARTGLTVAAALGLSAFFWLPVLLERGLVRLDDVITKEHVDYHRFLIEPLGTSFLSGMPGYLYTPIGPFDFSLVYAYDPFAPIKPHWLQILPAALSVTLLRRRLPLPPGEGQREAQGEVRGAVGTPALDFAPARGVAFLAAAAFLTALAAWWITTTWSLFLWDRVRALQSLQFTYRPLGIVAFAVAVLGGLGAARLPLPRLPRLLLLATLAGALALTALAGRDPRTGSAGGSGGVTPRAIDAARFRSLDQMAGYHGTTAREEFMPRTVRIDVFSDTDPRAQLFATLYPEPSWFGGVLLPYRGRVSVLGLQRGGLELRARVEAGPDGAAIGVRQLDFPGWTAYVDDQRAPHGRMPYRQDVQATLGFILLDVPPGVHDLALSFELTAPRLAGQALSLLTLASLCAAAARHAPRRPAVVFGALCVALLGCALYTAVDWSLRQTRAGPPRVHLSESLVLNVARAVEEKVAVVESPTGATLGPNAFADLRWLQLGPSQSGGAQLAQGVEGAVGARGAHGGALRRWLYLHPPARVTAELDVPAGGVFQAGLALDPATWDTPEGDGVRFIVEVQEAAHGARAAGGPVVLLDRHVNPRARSEERGWNDVTVDLSRFAGRRIRLTLRTDPAANLANDWAGWGNPAVVTRPSARWR